MKLITYLRISSHRNIRHLNGIIPVVDSVQYQEYTAIVTPVRIAGVTAEIRSEYLRNARLGFQYYSNLLYLTTEPSTCNAFPIP
jgi:hypothetical protein